MTAGVQAQPAHTVITLDIGGTKIASGLAMQHADGTWTITRQSSVPTPALEGGPATLAALVAEADARYAEARADGAQVVGVGVSAAGVIDTSRGVVTSATDTLPGWAGTDIRGALQDALGVPAYILNDVQAHALGEVTLGAGAPFSCALMVAVGTGIGGAVVMNHRVLPGPRGLAGNFGHMHHELANGFMCSCGRTGHLEAVASGYGIAALYGVRAGGVRVPGAAEVAQLAAMGNAVARTTLADAGAALGEILGGLTNAFDPEAVLVSGSVAKAGPVWWDGVRSGFARELMDPARETPLLTAALGDDAPLLGAAVGLSSYLNERN